MEAARASRRFGCAAVGLLPVVEEKKKLSRKNELRERGRMEDAAETM